MARATFLSHVGRAIENVRRLSNMVRPQIVHLKGGGAHKAMKLEASPTALQANLAIIDRALGKPTERMEGSQITVPIQIVMGGGRVVDVAAPPTAAIEIRP